MRLLISSRNTLIPVGLTTILSDSDHQVVSHYFQSPDQLIAKVILERSEVVLMDKSDAELFLFEEIAHIRQRLPHLKMILLSGKEHLSFMERCYALGVEGYLIYDCGADEIKETIDTVAAGSSYYCQKILSALLPRLARGEQPIAPEKPLTEREMQIARRIASGQTNKQIGAALCISPHTVHTHRKSLMKKLAVSSARELALRLLSDPS